MTIRYKYDAIENENFLASVRNAVNPSVQDDCALGANILLVSKSCDWLIAANTVISALGVSIELQKNHIFQCSVAVLILASLSPVSLKLVSDDAVRLLDVIEKQGKHRTVNLQQMQKILGEGHSRQALLALEKAGFISQEANGVWFINRIRLSGFQIFAD